MSRNNTHTNAAKKQTEEKTKITSAQSFYTKPVKRPPLLKKEQECCCRATD